MVSLVAVLQSGATVETATIGRAWVIGASAIGSEDDHGGGSRAAAGHGRVAITLLPGPLNAQPCAT
jgi:hypothetical protein